jgi:hypothetical protein
MTSDSPFLCFEPAVTGVPENSIIKHIHADRAPSPQRHFHEQTHRPCARSTSPTTPIRTEISRPVEMNRLPVSLRTALIREMAMHFTTLWRDSDPRLRTSKQAIETLTAMAHDSGTVFLVQHDQRGRLVATASIVKRDVPGFRDTGPNGSDLYGDHWIANVFSLYPRKGHGTAQIEALKRIALHKGWPHLWLYCKDSQDGVDLPKYYSKRLGFQPVGKELVYEATRLGEENIMRFDTATMR